ncbi:L,D-transpeptidase [Mesorhizobium sp. NPDC059054]|uniref:L,D-transpeptidase n=1 Tax=Mesorhizobium sp. NPDC059054 TaxID=3346711 RepID=UPI00368C3A89
MTIISMLRRCLPGIAVLPLMIAAGCSQTIQANTKTTAVFPPTPAVAAAAAPATVEPVAYQSKDAERYAAVDDGGYSLPAIDVSKVDPKFLRQLVDDPTGEPAGSIVVDTRQNFLYLVQPNGKAMRYGVGLGKQGHAWKGRAIVQWKRKWPTWTPPAAMISRDKKLEKWRQGMQPGVSNPLGARALYIFKDGKDTLYRIHGSPQWRSIGKSASAGCVRMFNQDVIDLYGRVSGKAPLLVM